MWNKRTAFLEWIALEDTKNNWHLSTCICDTEYLVSKDSSGQTYEVSVGGKVISDEYESAAHAQLATMGFVLTDFADRAGDPMRPAATDDERLVRAELNRIHLKFSENGNLITNREKYFGPDDLELGD